MSLNDRCGFTLLEAVVALAIVAGSLAAAFAVAAADLDARRRADRTREAAVLVDEVYAAADLLSAGELERLERGSSGRFEPPLDGYSWQIRSVPVAEQSGLFDVEISVTWMAGSLGAATRLARTPAEP